MPEAQLCANRTTKGQLVPVGLHAIAALEASQLPEAQLCANRTTKGQASFRTFGWLPLGKGYTSYVSHMPLSDGRYRRDEGEVPEHGVVRSDCFAPQLSGRLSA